MPKAPKRAGKTWGGRFDGKTDPLVDEYTLSLPVDMRMWREEIAASTAHARMLGRQKIIPRSDAGAIVRGLREIAREIERGSFPWRNDLEDIHTNIEARLVEKIGPTGGKLHTARSRNDQIATDLRLYAFGACERVIAAARALQRALVELADANRSVIMPGYTHLQRAQPVLLAHHLLAYVEMLQRDITRFGHARNAADALPLGSGALAGVPYNIDRKGVAKELGFSYLCENSIDAVADRDFAVDFVAAAALCMTHLSRLSEEVILWSSAEFGYLNLPDAYSTGSSIMPQKRNPDIAELARGRTGYVDGLLQALLTTLKGLPLAYNRDLQEDKRAFFEAEETLLRTLTIYAAMIPSFEFDEARARNASTANFALATDYADMLVRAGVPFRDAHAAVGKLVRYAEQQNTTFDQLTSAEFRRFSTHFPDDAASLTVEDALSARSAEGGTSPRRVAAQLRKWRAKLQAK